MAKFRINKYKGFTIIGKACDVMNDLASINKEMAEYRLLKDVLEENRCISIK